TRTSPIRLSWHMSRYSTEARKENSESIDLQIHTVDGKTVAGGLRATIYSPAGQPFPALRCGDEIHTTLAMHLPERYLDPGVWDSAQWLLGQGIGVVGSLKAQALNIAQRRGTPSFRCWLRSLQEAGTGRLRNFADSSDADSRL